MKLYSTDRSGHAHTVRTLLSILDLPHETIEISTAAGSNRTESYLKINPFGQIPVLDDDGFIVRDSHAILYYLARKYDASGRWMPRDVETATRVQEWLATSTLDLVIGPTWARAATRFGRPIDLPAAQKRGVRLFGLVDAHLSTRAWLATDHATIADLTMYTYLALAPEGGIDISPFEHVAAWMKRVEALPGHVPCPVPT